MFGNKKSNNTPLVMSQEKFNTLIGKNSEIHGCLLLKESVRIDGKVIGNIEAPRDKDISVVIGPTGEILGDVIAGRIIVAGKVSGNIHSYERVELLSSALVQGDTKYASIAVEHGARLLGLLLQVNGTDMPAHPERDAQDAIRKAQTSGVDES